MAQQNNGGRPQISGGSANLDAPGINRGGPDASKAMQEQAGSEGAAPQSSGAKVTVACKVALGMRLRIYKMAAFREPAMGGVTRESKIAERIGEEDVVVHGPACAPDKRPRCIITESGYALTTGVDKDYWNLWLEQNKNQPYVKRRLIFAMDHEADARDAAADLGEVRSGLEPLDFDPSTDPRVPRAAAAGVGGVTRGEDNRAKQML